MNWDRRASEPGADVPEDFGERVPYLLRRLNGALSQRLDERLRAFALTQSQLSALALLGLELPEGLSGAELSERSGVTPQSMSAALAGLLARGLVERRPHATHGRILESRITPDGLVLLEQVQSTTRDLEARDLSGLDADEQQQLKALLQRAVRSLGLHLPGG